MDQTGLLIVMWIASGAFLGGVLTPVLTAGRRLNEWAAMAIGLVTGAVGNLLLLVPLWLGLSRVAPAEETHEPAWKRDAVTLDDLLAAEAAGTGGVLPPNPLPDRKSVV